MRLRTTVIDRDLTSLGEVVLERYQAETGEQGYQVSLNGHFLMGAHGCHGERALATVAWERLRRPQRDLSVLVGGLGAGHTLRASLDLPGVERVVVVEISPKVVLWNRRWFAPFHGYALEDTRVEVRVADLWEVLSEAASIPGGVHDLMLLDVDNGPGWLAAEQNARLYQSEGLRRCRDALRSGGVLGVWSPAHNPTFLRVFRSVFPDGEEFDLTSLARKDGSIADVLYLGVRDP